MKKVILFITMIFVLMDAKGQTSGAGAEGLNPYPFKIDSTTIVKKYEIDYIRYTLGNYHKERSTGFVISVSGYALALTAFGAKGEAAQTPLFIGSGVASLIGIIVLMDAEKWLKGYSIKPASSGVGVSVSINKPSKQKVKKKWQEDDLYR